MNTDFIDNSAGVDTSDHEVNIKILLAGAIASGEIQPQERGGLLHALTDEVAAHVLRHNDGQNMALAVARYQAPRLLHVHARYLRQLARQNRVSLERDGLPGDKEIAARRSAGTGLTTPELALLLAHTKIAAGQQVLASDLPDDPALRSELAEYFPAPLRERFADQLGVAPAAPGDHHHLGDQRDGRHRRVHVPVPAGRGDRAAGARHHPGVAGGQRGLRHAGVLAAGRGAGGVVDVDARIAIVLEARKLVERATRWLLVNRRPPFGIAETADFFAAGVAAVRSAIPKLLSGRDLVGYEERRASFTGRGVPADLADEVAAMVPSYSAFDIVTVASASSRGVAETAAVYFALADRLQLGRLRDLIVALPREDRWAAMSRSALRDDLYAAHAALTRDVLAGAGNGRDRRGGDLRGGVGGAELRCGLAGGGDAGARSGRATGSPSPRSRWRSV